MGDAVKVQYLGGKTRIAKQIAAEIDKVRRPGQLVWDAFCGGLSVSRALMKNGPVLSTDACAPLIALYPFDHAAFMRRAEEWACFVPVFVSGYALPIGREVWSRPSPGGCGLKRAGAAVERLFYLGPEKGKPKCRTAT